MSPSASSAASAHASMLAVSTRSGIITPFGSLVEPLVYCRITRRSGSGAGVSSASPVGTFGEPGMTERIGRIGGSSSAAT